MVRKEEQKSPEKDLLVPLSHRQVKEWNEAVSENVGASPNQTRLYAIIKERVHGKDTEKLLLDSTQIGFLWEPINTWSMGTTPSKLFSSTN